MTAGSSDPLDDRVTQLRDSISAGQFDAWYREREYRQNILNGTPYFNGVTDPKPPKRHSPSKLLKCHRQDIYHQQNAPEETKDPHGIFWTGTKFEEELILPFLESIAGDNNYVTNSLWIDFTVDTDVGELQIKGETDPVLVDRNAEPLLLTEIKTKASVEDVDEPSKHHKAQAHAYMMGLSEIYDRNITEAVIVYGSRKTLDITAIPVEFDAWFWRERIISWAENHTTYRLNEELPPADPEFDWECQYCAYRERCGEGDLRYEDTPPVGLLPNFEYPRQKLVEYLQAYENAKLTPTTAHQHPDLAEEHEVFDWKCRGCGATISWDEVTWDGDVSMPPGCPSCSGAESFVPLRGPRPVNQLDDSHW
jgi:CRISPR-associated exonuclease Cas4